MKQEEMEKYLEEASGMDLYGLVDRLREQWKEICSCLTDFDEATTALYEPGGSLSALLVSLKMIMDRVWLTYTMITQYQEESEMRKIQEEVKSRK